MSIYQYGIHKQFSTKADEDDGLSIYFGLISLSRPSAASYREEIDNQLNSAADLFRRGDPTKKIKSLRPYLTEALRLKMPIKWTVGKKIITTLALRHSTFAVDLAYLKETASNIEDSAGHIDWLFAQITKSCADIESIQGDRWADVQAHYGNTNRSGNSDGNTNNGSKTSNIECRYGDKCTRANCRYSHKKVSKISETTNLSTSAALRTVTRRQQVKVKSTATPASNAAYRKAASRTSRVKSAAWQELLQREPRKQTNISFHRNRCQFYNSCTKVL